MKAAGLRRFTISFAQMLGRVLIVASVMGVLVAVPVMGFVWLGPIVGAVIVLVVMAAMLAAFETWGSQP